jgi:hypothetical protein
MYKIHDYINHEIIKLNEPENPTADHSRHAIGEVLKLASSITQKSLDVTNQQYLNNSMRMLTALEIFMSTHDRHCKFIGKECQDIRLSFGLDFVELLLRLSLAAVHPPRGSHWNMWVDYQESGPVLYTGHPDERRFAMLVRQTDVVMRRLADYGVAVISGQTTFLDPETSSALTELVADLDAVRKGYFEFGRYNERPDNDYEDRWFLHFRQFLAPLMICRENVRGPNPAHVASWPEVDILFGLANDDYLNSVKGRYCSYLPKDIFRLERSFKLPSVPSVLHEELTNHALRYEERKQIVTLFRQLVKSLTAVSGMHWSSIVKNLKKPSASQISIEKLGETLSVDAGVSGRDLGETEALLLIRRNCNPANDFLEKHFKRDKHVA